MSLINTDGRNAAVDLIRVGVELFTRPFLPSPLAPPILSCGQLQEMNAMYMYELLTKFNLNTRQQPTLSNSSWKLSSLFKVRTNSEECK